MKNQILACTSIATWALLMAPGCGSQTRSDGNDGNCGSSPCDSGSDPFGPQGDGDDSDSDSDGDEPKLDMGSVRFDIGDGQDTSNGEGSGDDGCQKVDFLFVVDNSGSMNDEQENLVNSFPGFIATIEQTLDARDYQIMVVDTDSWVEPGSGSTLTCSPAPQCCTSFCNSNPSATCNGALCGPMVPTPTGCDAELGAGRRTDPFAVDCGFATPSRYMVDGQADLTTTFQCAATVGTGGDGDERPMEAMTTAVTTLNAAGQCNEGFVRDDAILVVTFITDEAEGASTGTPDTWRQALVDAKGGVETAVVMLGLVGDTDLPGAVCAGGLAGVTGADAAPMLRDFAESFTYGLWGSVCALDYSPFFEQATSVIDTACDDFVPPG